MSVIYNCNPYTHIACIILTSQSDNVLLQRSLYRMLPSENTRVIKKWPIFYTLFPKKKNEIEKGISSILFHFNTIQNEMKPVNFILCDFFSRILRIHSYIRAKQHEGYFIIMKSSRREKNIYRKMKMQRNVKIKMLEWKECMCCPQFKTKIPWIFPCSVEMSLYLIKVTQTDSQCAVIDDNSTSDTQSFRYCMHY